MFKTWSMFCLSANSGIDPGSPEGVRRNVGLWHPQGRRHVHADAMSPHVLSAATWAPHDGRLKRRWLHPVHRQALDRRHRHQHRWTATSVSWWRQHTGVHIVAMAIVIVDGLFIGVNVVMATVIIDGLFTDVNFVMAAVNCCWLVYRYEWCCYGNSYCWPVYRCGCCWHGKSCCWRFVCGCECCFHGNSCCWWFVYRFGCYCHGTSILLLVCLQIWMLLSLS